MARLNDGTVDNTSAQPSDVEAPSHFPEQQRLPEPFLDIDAKPLIVPVLSEPEDPDEV